MPYRHRIRTEEKRRRIDEKTKIPPHDKIVSHLISRASKGAKIILNQKLISWKKQETSKGSVSATNRRIQLYFNR